MSTRLASNSEILSPPVPKCWDSRCGIPCPAMRNYIEQTRSYADVQALLCLLKILIHSFNVYSKNVRIVDKHHSKVM